MSKRKSASPRLPDSIVVGVDERGLADHAVRRAFELGETLEARVHLVQAVPVPPRYWIGTDPVRSAAISAEVLTATSRSVNERVRSIVEERARSAPSIDGRGRTAVAAPSEAELVRVIPGQPAPVLLEEVRKRRAGLLVLGAHGKRELLDFGNTLRAVFAKASVPLWVQAQPVAPIRSILAAVDLSKESLSALAMATALAGRLGARIRVVHGFHVDNAAVTGGFEYGGYGPGRAMEEVRESERTEFTRTMDGFDWQDVPHDAEFVDGEPVKAILERADAADLVVLGTHGRTGLASVLLGGVAYAVLKRSPKPVLAVRVAGRSFLM